MTAVMSAIADITAAQIHRTSGCAFVNGIEGRTGFSFRQTQMMKCKFLCLIA